AFEISRARHRPNAEAMTSIARGNEVNTKPAHTKSFRPDVSVAFPAPAMEYARTATTAIRKRKRDPRAALDAVAAAPQPSCPPSPRVVLSAAANHMRLRTAKPENT